MLHFFAICRSFVGQKHLDPLKYLPRDVRSLRLVRRCVAALLPQLIAILRSEGSAGGQGFGHRARLIVQVLVHARTDASVPRPLRNASHMNTYSR